MKRGETARRAREALIEAPKQSRAAEQGKAEWALKRVMRAIASLSTAQGDLSDAEQAAAKTEGGKKAAQLADKAAEATHTAYKAAIKADHALRALAKERT